MARRCISVRFQKFIAGIVLGSTFLIVILGFRTKGKQSSWIQDTLVETNRLFIPMIKTRYHLQPIQHFPQDRLPALPPLALDLVDDDLFSETFKDLSSGEIDISPTAVSNISAELETVHPDNSHDDLSYVSMQRKHKGWPFRRKLSPTSRKNKTVEIIVYAKYRTGSTFTSEFFFHHRDIAYIFEPLNQRNNLGYVKNIHEILWDMFHCKMVDNKNMDLINEAWLTYHVFCQVANQTPGCVKREKVPLSRAEEHCKNVHNRAIKVIRVENIWELDEFIRSGIKIVHLVRDVRGVVHSRDKLKHINITAIASKYCKEAVQDIQYMAGLFKTDPAFRKLYHIVRYEDLAQQPRRQMEKLYGYLGIVPDSSLLEWISGVEKASLSKDTVKKEKVNAYGTDRANPAYTAIAWRDEMRFKDVELVQSVCEDFMDIFGYLPVHTENDLRNRSNPILD